MHEVWHRIDHRKDIRLQYETRRQRVLFLIWNMGTGRPQVFTLYVYPQVIMKELCY